MWNLFKKEKSKKLVAPVDGKLIPLSQVKDEAFASGALGTGYAVMFDGNKVVAPADGTIEACFPTGHAVGIKTSFSEIIVHIGIDTVQMEGKGFHVLVKNGDVVKTGDVIVETKRASGAGGQHINKTDSAVRMVHKPTGIVATCQNGRSQHENREECLRVLKSRLYQLEIEEQEKKIAQIKGVQSANEWGSQIRSYVMHPYSLVKDVRTGYETSQVQSVLDGDLDEFIFAYLKSQIQ